MKIVFYLLSCMAAALILSPFSRAGAAQRTVVANGVGAVIRGDMGAARDQAIRDAQLRAVEQACGVRVEGRTVLHRTLLIDDTLVMQSAGRISAFQVLEEKTDGDGLYHVTLKAVVNTSDPEAKGRRFGSGSVLLMVSETGNASGDNADGIFSKTISEALTGEGFQVLKKRMSDDPATSGNAKGLAVLLEKTGSDVLIRAHMEIESAVCPVGNLCISKAYGRIRLFDGSAESREAVEEEAYIRGFGNTPSAAEKEAARNGGVQLMDGILLKLCRSRTRPVHIAVHNLPDPRSHAAFRDTLASLRWVRRVEEDAVGFHPNKSVYYVWFDEHLDMLAKMLQAIGGFDFRGRSGTTFDLVAGKEPGKDNPGKKEFPR